MPSTKIFNDPVYGFVSIPYGIIFQLVEHPYFQRLRRIKQVSMSHYVYPGALHTRFHHALGAFHLMTQAIETLRSKDVEITEDEATAASIAILLHDIGHGPFSHTLEHTLIDVHHETLSLRFMETLNREFNGALEMAIQIFKDAYPKHFLHQLVSSQLDMDRMDYLNRDSFFTGVYEGVIGYDRIIKMLSVYEGELVIEEKGIYSVEKFLIARRLMYWQVYLHKTVLAAERMLIQAFLRARELYQEGHALPGMSPGLQYLMEFGQQEGMLDRAPEALLEQFATLDDFDVVFAIKSWANFDDPVLAYLAQGLVERHLFKLEMSNTPFDRQYVAYVRQRILDWGHFEEQHLPHLLIEGYETNSAYSTSKEEINILFKNGTILPMSMSSDHDLQSKIVTKYYLCYPKAALKSIPMKVG